MDWPMVLSKAAIIAACGIAAILGNWPVRRLLKSINPDNHSRDSQSHATTKPTLLDTEKQLPGGRWIGILERIGVVACIVAEFPAGLAIIIAIKGLGRYPEIRAQETAGADEGSQSRAGELFIIGTLASMIWAAAFAGLAYGLVRLW